jgi:hypothetical protein
VYQIVYDADIINNFNNENFNNELTVFVLSQIASGLYLLINLACLLASDIRVIVATAKNIQAEKILIINNIVIIVPPIYIFKNSIL